MDVTSLPFNSLIGLQAATDSEDLVFLPDGVQYTNHLGTVHASALLAVAEAGSGAFLARHFPDTADLVPVVRRLEAKFRKPAQGRVAARVAVPDAEVNRWREEFAVRGRVLAPVPVAVVDGAGVVVLTATAEWFLMRSGKSGA